MPLGSALILTTGLDHMICLANGTISSKLANSFERQLCMRAYCLTVLGNLQPHVKAWAGL